MCLSILYCFEFSSHYLVSICHCCCLLIVFTVHSNKEHPHCVQALESGPRQTQIRRSRRLAVIIFFTTFVQFGAFALAFWYGSVVVDQGHCSFADIFKALIGTLICGIVGGIYAYVVTLALSSLLAGILSSCILILTLNVFVLQRAAPELRECSKINTACGRHVQRVPRGS